MLGDPGAAGRAALRRAFGLDAASLPQASR
jgi:hypothetical protein